MAKKTITIEVMNMLDPQSANGGVVHQFMVKKLTNSTAYIPAQILAKSEVDALCESGAWEVTITGHPDSRLFSR